MLGLVERKVIVSRKKRMVSRGTFEKEGKKGEVKWVRKGGADVGWVD